MDRFKLGQVVVTNFTFCPTSRTHSSFKENYLIERLQKKSPILVVLLCSLLLPPLMLPRCSLAAPLQSGHAPLHERKGSSTNALKFGVYIYTISMYIINRASPIPSIHLSFVHSCGMDKQGRPCPHPPTHPPTYLPTYLPPQWVSKLVILT